MGSPKAWPAARSRRAAGIRWGRCCYRLIYTMSLVAAVYAVTAHFRAIPLHRSGGRLFHYCPSESSQGFQSRGVSFACCTWFLLPLHSVGWHFVWNFRIWCGAQSRRKLRKTSASNNIRTRMWFPSTLMWGVRSWCLFAELPNQVSSLQANLMQVNQTIPVPHLSRAEQEKLLWIEKPNSLCFGLGNITILTVAIDLPKVWNTFRNWKLKLYYCIEWGFWETAMLILSFLWLPCFTCVHKLTRN